MQIKTKENAKYAEKSAVFVGEQNCVFFMLGWCVAGEVREKKK